MNKRRWFIYYPACLIIPHIMIFVGLVLLASMNPDKRLLGKRLALLSTLMLVVGSLVYYMLFMPIFGLD